MITTRASKTPAAVLLLLLLLPAVLLVNPATADVFDFYRLVIQWGPGICSETPCGRPIQQEFTIHGFWPATYIPPDPSGLDGRPIPWTLQTFKAAIYNSPIPGLTIALRTSWPQMFVDGRPDADERFWFYQWRAHGICSPFAPDVYFAEGLKAFTSYNVLAGLIFNNIVPINNVFYLAKDIQRAVVGNPTLRCYQSPDGNYYVLTEMRFCFSNDIRPVKIICQSPSLGSCGGPNGRVLFLPANAPPPSSVQINSLNYSSV